jgi:hypothetical protein
MASESELNTASNNLKKKLPDIVDFCNTFSKYPSIHLYNLIRDLILKSDSLDQSDEFRIYDAKESLRIDDYVVMKHSKQDGKRHLYISLKFGDELDLNWIHEVCVASEDSGLEVILCVHSIDGIT